MSNCNTVSLAILVLIDMISIIYLHFRPPIIVKLLIFDVTTTLKHLA